MFDSSLPTNFQVILFDCREVDWLGTAESKAYPLVSLSALPSRSTASKIPSGPLGEKISSKEVSFLERMEWEFHKKV